MPAFLRLSDLEEFDGCCQINSDLLRNYKSYDFMSITQKHPDDRRVKIIFHPDIDIVIFYYNALAPSIQNQLAFSKIGV